MLPVMMVVFTESGPPKVSEFCTPKQGASRQTRHLLSDVAACSKSAMRNSDTHTGDAASPGRAGQRCLI